MTGEYCVQHAGNNSIIKNIFTSCYATTAVKKVAVQYNMLLFEKQLYEILVLLKKTAARKLAIQQADVH
jgi:hypothetical protein